MPLDQRGYLRVNREALFPSVCIPNYRTAVSTRITSVGKSLGQVQCGQMAMSVARYGARANAGGMGCMLHCADRRRRKIVLLFL